MAEAKKYRIRPHHGMCLYFFEGKGYSDGFTAHMTEVKKSLSNEEESVSLMLVGATDEICSACPHNKGGRCESAEKVDRYDNGVLQYTGLREGQEMTFPEFEQLVEEKILTPGYGIVICGDCQWRDICHKEQRVASQFPVR